MRYIGAVLLVTACSMLGFAAALKKERRVHSLEAMIKFLELYSVELNCSMSGTDELIRRTAAMTGAPGFIEAYTELTDGGVSLPEAWKRSVQEAKVRMGLERGDVGVIAELGDVIGRYDAQSQTLAIASRTAQLRGALEEARRSREQKAPVYRTLGVLAGVAAAMALM